MIKEDLEGLKVSLNNGSIIEDFDFSGDKVIATMGTKEGAICASILDLKICNSSSLTIEGQGCVLRWENIQISNSQISTIRNGKPAIYDIKRKLVLKQRERRLP